MRVDIRRRIEALEAKAKHVQEVNPYLEMSTEDLIELMHEMIRQTEGIQEPTYDDRIQWIKKYMPNLETFCATAEQAGWICA